LTGDVAHVLEKYPKPLAMLADITHDDHLGAGKGADRC
jgi:hypothetical protein